MSTKMASRTHFFLAFICLFALTVLTEAGRKGQRKAWKKKDADGCKYMRTDAVTDCDPVTNTRNLTLSRKRGDPDKCPATKVMPKPCKKQAGCKYSKEGATWSDCDENNMKSIQLTVAEGQDPSCKPTFIKMRPCSRAGRRNRGKKGGRRGRGKNNNAGRNKAKAERKAAKKAKRQQRRKNKAAKVADNN